MQNNHFTRYYLAATKHFSFTGVGTLGVHAAYVDYRACWFPHYRRTAAGVDFKFNLLPEDNLAVKSLKRTELNGRIRCPHSEHRGTLPAMERPHQPDCRIE